MNIELREFLNINENGVDYYTWRDMSTSGWSETVSIGSQYHQNLAPDTNVSIIVGYYQNDFGIRYNTPIYKSVYNRLNAKFTNNDGREAVFKYPGLHISKGPDRGTFNYINALPIQNMRKHSKYDVDPFDKNLPERENPDTKKLYTIGTTGNSYYWQY
jgi:hypothetical protein